MTNSTTWAIDPMHSEVLFKIKHLLISTVTGSFRKFEGKVIFEGTDFEDAKISVTIDAQSIDTNQSQRDAHLRSGDFFETDIYSNITFESTSFRKTVGNTYLMNGNLTIKGITKSIDFHVEYGGSEDNGHGILKHGFEVTGIVNRKEFGMTWNQLTDAGGLGLGEEIKLIANIQIAQLVDALHEL